MINYVITLTEPGEGTFTYELFANTLAAALEDAMKQHLRLRQPLIFVTDDDTPAPNPAEMLSEGKPLTGDIVAPMKRWHPQMPVYVTVLRDVTIHVRPKFNHAIPY